MHPTVIVHGGAWAIPDSLAESSLVGVRIAAKKAWDIIENGGSAVDAVEAAVVEMEDNEVFDAGIGSVLTSAGTVEMDSIIMEGSQLRCGSVACVENIKNPVKLARIVMEKSDHILLVGKGANAFARQCGVEDFPAEKLVTKEAIDAFERYKLYNNTVESLFSDRNNGQSNELHVGHETVGCVALDKNGLLASATSTGGITAKRPGRVGDSPLVGCGAYADNESAAVSCTGHGESIAKICLAKKISDECFKGVCPKDAVDDSLSYMNKRVGQAGGAICIAKDGQYGIGFTTERMAWTIITHDEATYGINPNESILVKNV